jgi:predicted secreted hydrolase
MKLQGVVAWGAGALLLLAAMAWFGSGARAPSGEGMSLGQALGEDAALAGFQRAQGERDFSFPQDHGPHPGYRTEWWYWTGNLRTAEGRRFGYQLTFFRIALTPAAPPKDNPWRSHAIFMAHLALSDVKDGRFHFHERFSREAQGLAGAWAPASAGATEGAGVMEALRHSGEGRNPPAFAVWLTDWRVEGGDGVFPMRLSASAGDIALELTLEDTRGVVLQGEDGLSRKSAEHGNASWYYSMPRLTTRGRIRIGETAHAVEGTSWLDREWSTSALSADQVGWDWFALQLDSGHELMLYRLRRTDGSMDAASAGTLIAPDGGITRLSAADLRIEETAHWRSPASGVRYPAGWRLAIERIGLELEVAPAMPDQELRVSVSYWEGAVDVRGVLQGTQASGVGYVELAGYAAGRPVGSQTSESASDRASKGAIPATSSPK